MFFGNTDLSFTVCSNTVISFAAPPQKLSLMGSNGACLVEISLVDGTVKVNHPGSEPEAANVFWRAIGFGFPRAH